MAEKSELIRRDIERTRAEIDDTLDALGVQGERPGPHEGMGGRQEGRRGRRLRIGFLEGVGRNRLDDRAGLRCDSEQRRDARRCRTLQGHRRTQPARLGIAGAAVGFVAGLLRALDEIRGREGGPISDQVKSQAADVGEEALEHGKQVAQAVAGQRRRDSEAGGQGTRRGAVLVGARQGARGRTEPALTLRGGGWGHPPRRPGPPVEGTGNDSDRNPDTSARAEEPNAGRRRSSRPLRARLARRCEARRQEDAGGQHDDDRLGVRHTAASSPSRRFCLPSSSECSRWSPARRRSTRSCSTSAA